MEFSGLKGLELGIHSEYMEILQAKDKNMVMFHSNGRVKQIDLYCMLKSFYGKPNGVMTLFRADDSSNFIQWDYCLKKDGVYYDILGSTRFLEFRVITKDKIDDFDEEECISVINNEIIENNSSIKKKKNEIEYWNVFANTYNRLRNTVEFNYEEFIKIKINDPITIKSPIVSKIEFQRYNHQMKKFTKNILEKKNFGIILRMIIPVAGESLINLIIFVLAKDEIKSDKRMMDNVFRSQIDIRIKSMFLNCNGIDNKYDQNDARFKNFLKIMNKRNDFLHGNVTPAINTFDNVYFDGTIPIFNEEKDMAIEFMKQNIFLVEEEIVKQEYKALQDFREYILENMKKGIREQVEMFIDKSELGYNNKTRRVGILFDDAMMQSIMITKPNKK